MTTGPKTEMGLREKLHRDRIAAIRGDMILAFSLGVIGIVVAIVMAPLIWETYVAVIACVVSLSLSVPSLVAGFHFASAIKVEEERYNRQDGLPEKYAITPE